jgi:propionyl-CoA synthetase
VKSLFAAPTAVRAIRKEDSQAKELAKYDISSLKAFFLAGEVSGGPESDCQAGLS